MRIRRSTPGTNGLRETRHGPYPLAIRSSISFPRSSRPAATILDAYSFDNGTILKSISDLPLQVRRYSGVSRQGQQTGTQASPPATSSASGDVSADVVES